jgi:hypothetical protein
MTTMTLSPTQSATASTGSEQERTDQPFTSMNYFTASYLPTLIAVAFRVLWTIVYNNARLMEPFYRLASPSGAMGKHFLNTL